MQAQPVERVAETTSIISFADPDTLIKREPNSDDPDQWVKVGHQFKPRTPFVQVILQASCVRHRILFRVWL